MILKVLKAKMLLKLSKYRPHLLLRKSEVQVVIHVKRCFFTGKGVFYVGHLYNIMKSEGQ